MPQESPQYMNAGATDFPFPFYATQNQEHEGEAYWAFLEQLIIQARLRVNVDCSQL